MSTRLSIIIPAYNCEAWIDDCLRSVLLEMTERDELILVDDGSSDSTASILSSYERTYEQIHVLFCDHKGASGARNAGLRIAKGEYVAFVDCDDRLKRGFLAKAAPLIEQRADLSIFGVERIYRNGAREAWTVRDHSYANASAFADAYIREGRMMIYSNCNKFYRRDLIERGAVRFEEGMEFGEDRLFNYRYLLECETIRTSSLIMLEYVQRKTDSMSGRHVQGYFNTVMRLHDAKMQCMLALSRGTDEAERAQFAAEDAVLEISRTIERFEDHPEEIPENLPLIEQMVCAEEKPADGWYRNSEERERILNAFEMRLRNRMRDGQSQ